MSECVRVRVGVSSVFLSSVLLDIFSICHLLRIYGMDGNMDCWRENNKKIPTRKSLCVPSSDQKVNILWKITKNERTLDFFLEFTSPDFLKRRFLFLLWMICVSPFPNTKLNSIYSFVV